MSAGLQLRNKSTGKDIEIEFDANSVELYHSYNYRQLISRIELLAVTNDLESGTYEYRTYLNIDGKKEYSDDWYEFTKSENFCPDENHPHSIDLGLPSGTKWACCNVGATTPEGYGNYYAWGVTSPKSVYRSDNYQYGSSSANIVNIGSDIAGTGYDAATANWGSPWRMPTKAQCVELRDNCNYTWTTQNGVYGRKFTGPNGCTIFLPAAGYRLGSVLNFAGAHGAYWSSSLVESIPYCACSLYFYSGGGVLVCDDIRNHGFSVRPVR